MAETPQNSGEENVIRLDSAAKDSSAQKSLKKPLEKIKALFSKAKFSGILGKFGGVGEKLKALKDKPALAKIREKLQNKKIRYAVFGGVGAALLLIIILALVFSQEKPLENVYKPPQVVKKPQVKGTRLKASDKNELQEMMKKASLLYSTGHIAEALDIYRNIAVFSQSFASFNLGVAKLAEKNYKDSIEAFNNAIRAGDNTAAAAINAAVGAYKMGEANLYDYYVSLAKGRLVEWYDKPLYSYLYSLVNYYDGKYFNTFSSLKNKTSDFYPSKNAQLLAQIYLTFNDDHNALKTLIDDKNTDNRFEMGLLYARLGEYDLAIEQLESYMRDYDLEHKQGLMAQGLIEIKRGDFIRVASIYEKLLEKHEASEIQKIYPIKIKIHDSFFNVDLLQNKLWTTSSLKSRAMDYKILFYFAPFRVFDIDRTLSLIEEGGLKLKMNNVEEASSTFARTAMLGRINAEITTSLKHLLSHNITNALNVMKDAAKAYPNHQVLQYNLGLIYAQTNDFANARRHFLKAFHLDNNDILSAIFALMCTQLTFGDANRITTNITANFETTTFQSATQEGFIRSLYGFVTGNVVDDLPWFDEDSLKNPMMCALRAIYSTQLNDKATLTAAFGDLVSASGSDMVAVILAQIANHFGENMKSFSISMFDFFKDNITNQANLYVVYSGPVLARQLYTLMAFLVGANSYVDELLNHQLQNEQGDVSGIYEALALNAIYLGEFEKAFSYYNTIIDDYKTATSETYFLAGVAAVGAGHFDNAVALIQLSELESRVNLEARFALGLLHQTMGNFKLAALHFSQIGDRFHSAFFDFDIDTSEALKGE